MALLHLFSTSSVTTTESTCYCVTIPTICINIAIL